MSKFAVGLIGGIATGKSLASQYFKDLGIDVIDSDQIARELVEPGMPALQEIVKHFGEDILMPTGQLNRAALRDLVFSRPTERLWLENLLHPLIRERIDVAIDESTSPYCVVAIPLLKQREDYPKLNSILALQTDRHVQKQRLLQRDNITPELAEHIIAAQPTSEETAALATFIIANSGEPEYLQEQIRLFDQTQRSASC